MIACLFCDIGLAYQEGSSASPERSTAAAELNDGEPIESELAATNTSTTKSAYEIVVHTPISSLESARIRAAISNIQSTEPNSTVVIRFMGDDDNATSLGEGSEYEASLAIARLLIGPIGGKIRSMAYIDKPLVGHAVLVALACERIAITPEAEIGSAGIGEASIDETVLLTYQNIAAQRGRFPPAVVVSMLDANAQVYEVTLTDGRQKFVNQQELDELVGNNAVVRQTRLSVPGQAGYFKGDMLREKNFIDFSPDTLEQLQANAQIPLIKNVAIPEIANKSKAVMFELNSEITALVGNRCVRAIRESISGQGTSLCFIKIDSLGGSLEECNRLASFILDLNSEGIKTCAIIEGRCKGGAALIAMACGQCYAVKASQFGGDGEPVYTREQILELRGLWENLSSMSGKPEGQFYSVISTALPLFEYLSNAGGRTAGTPELIERPGGAIQWQKVPQPVEIKEVNLDLASRLGWIGGVVGGANDVAKLYGLETLPAPIQMSQLEELISRLAENDTLHWFLFTIGLVTFTTELTAPGGMVFGFVSFVCFAAFFWLKMLNGTVDTLEIMLFVAGIACICMEVFVLPGFGIFGIGGIVMCLAGAILASQRFVIPVTSVQWTEFAWNSLKVASIGLGSVLLLVAMSSRLSNSRFFKRLELQPSPAIARAPNIVDDLTGMHGVTVTRCAPYGMAKIHGRTHEVRSEADYIGEGKQIVVASMQGETAIVKEASQA